MTRATDRAKREAKSYAKKVAMWLLAGAIGAVGTYSGNKAIDGFQSVEKRLASVDSLKLSLSYLWE